MTGRVTEQVRVTIFGLAGLARPSLTHAAYAAGRILIPATPLRTLPGTGAHRVAEDHDPVDHDSMSRDVVARDVKNSQ